MNGRQGGFTLLEMLVALVVLGFIVAGLSAGMRFGLIAWGTQSRLIGERQDIDAVDRTLRQLIESIDPGTLVNPLPVRGTSNNLAFTSEMPTGPGLTLRRADLGLGVDATHRLVLRWTPHRHVVRFGPAAAPQTSELLRGVDHLELAYLGKNGVWEGRWTQATPPRLIRMRLTFAKGDPRHWPEIVASPMRDPPQTATESSN